MKGKQKPAVVFQPKVYNSLQRGIHHMVSALRPTLGPLSGGVAIDHINKSKSLPEFLDDGGVIARRIIELANRDEDMGAMLVRSMVLRQHQRIGDGTATVAVLFEAIFSAGVKYIAAGGNAMMLRRHLENALPLVLDSLDRMAFQLDGQDAFTRMAFSLCHDDEMAALLGEAFDLVGDFGRLDIRSDYGRGLRREYVEGHYYHSGLLSKTLLPDGSAGKIALENAVFVLCDFEIEDHRDLFPVLQLANVENAGALVIVARSLSEKAIALLIAHNRLNKFKAIAVKLPGLNQAEREAALDDLSLLTGATPFLKIINDKLENISPRHLGGARRVWADVHAFGWVGGQGNPRVLREHLQRLKTKYTGLDDPDDVKRLHERIANLLGGAFTLYVGGFTETEITVRKALADRAALALRVAVQGGVVPGGGTAFLTCQEVLKKRLKSAHDADEKAAYRILMEALAAPARTIFKNAGYDPSAVIARLNHAGANAGFDALTGRVVNVCDAGILDSAVVLKTCVRNAISTAALALTIDSFVHLSRPEMVGKPE